MLILSIFRNAVQILKIPTLAKQGFFETFWWVI